MQYGQLQFTAAYQPSLLSYAQYLSSQFNIQPHSFAADFVQNFISLLLLYQASKQKKNEKIFYQQRNLCVGWCVMRMEKKLQNEKKMCEIITGFC